jgi:hypothetical protein
MKNNKNNIIVFICIFLFLYIIIIKPINIQYDLSIKKSNKKKVFCIGLGRTATSSLTTALLNLGYDVWHCPILYESCNIRNYVNKFDGLTELPLCSEYDFKDLYNMYPDAQYILTVRDDDKWLKSTIKYKWLADNMICRCPGYGMFCKNFYKFDFSIESFREYNRDVLDFFKNKDEQLLVMNIPEGDGYEKLCPFLGIEYRHNLGEFPNVQEIKLQLYLRYKYMFS